METMSERSELYELIMGAVKAADAVKTKDVLLNSPAVTQCVDILKRLKGLCCSADSVFKESRTVSRLTWLTNHGNQEIRSEARNLLDLWLKTLYASGRRDSNKTALTRPLPKKPNLLGASGTSRSSVLEGREDWKDKNDEESSESETRISTNRTELLELFEAAKKAADAEKDSSLIRSPAALRCIEALNQIGRIPWSDACHVICTTDIGNRLQSLTKHNNPSIRSAAENLLCIWLKTLYSGGRTSHTDKKTEIKSMSRKIGRMKSQQHNRETVKSGMKKRNSKFNIHFTKKADERSGPCSPRADESSRGRVREILSKALAKVAGETWDSDLRQRVLRCDPSGVAASLESVMFMEWGSFRGPEFLKYKSIFSGMGDTNNSELRRKVLLGEITPKGFVAMRTKAIGNEKMPVDIEKRLQATERGNAFLKQFEQRSITKEPASMESV